MSLEKVHVNPYITNNIAVDDIDYVQDNKLVIGSNPRCVMVTDENDLEDLEDYTPGSIAYTAGYSNMWQLSSSGEWVSVGDDIDPAAIEQAVADWLDDHPEATTTVQDGSITKAKLVTALKEEIEGNTEDVTQLKNALQDIGNVSGYIETPLFDISSNIADITNLANGYIKDDGTIGTSNAYHYTQNYIKVIPGETYAVSGLTLGSISTYKSDKTFIGRISYSGNLLTTTLGSNVQYVRISGSGTPSGWRMNTGTSIIDEPCHTPYLGEDVSLKYQIDDTLSEAGKCADAKTTGDAVSFLNTAFEISPNIADTTDIADGYIKDDGTIGSSTAYHYTQNYIGVKPGGTYSIAGLSSISKYGISKNFIERILPSSSTITLDADTYYVRLSSNSATSDWRMNEGSTLYNHPYHPPYLGKDIEIYYQEMPSKWKGKTYAAIGDSITAGFIPRNDPAYPGTLNSYAKITAQKLGMSYIDYGVSGSSLAYVDGRSPISRRYTDMSDDADLITFLGGANDIRNGVQLGTMADRTDETYYGALHVLIGGLYKKYMIDQGTTIGKTKHIVALTPIKLLDPSSSSSSEGEGTLENLAPWAEAVKEVAAFYSIPCFDFYNLSGINPHIDRTVHGTESGYTGYYNPYITDGTHPTQDGQEIMANALCGFLETLL